MPSPPLSLRYASGPCSLGILLVATSAQGLCAILLADDDVTLLAELQRRFPRATLLAGDHDTRRQLAAVMALTDNPAAAFGLPLAPHGTAFQRQVWQALRAIPAGSTVSYRELATRIGAPRAVRAVASACAANPLAVAVPCHRVLRSDGTPGGYRWGLARKLALLAREAAMPPVSAPPTA